MGVPLRSEIAQEFKWRIEDLYATDELWEQEYKKVEEKINLTSEYKGRLGESENVLYLVLKASDELEEAVEKLYVYANQKYYEDTTNAKYQNYAGMAQNLSTAFYSEYSYIEPEILAMPEEKISKFLNSDGKIKLFAQYLKNILRQKKHILTAEMENVMANANDVAKSAKDIFSSFNNADIKFQSVKDSEGNTHDVSQGRYSMLMESKDRKLREGAFKAVYSAYGAYKNTLASMYNANVKQAVFFAKMRKFDSTIEMYLDSSNIPVEVYDNLIETVNKNLDLMHRYAALRKKVLKLEELHMYDIYVPLVDDYDLKVP